MSTVTSEADEQVLLESKPVFLRRVQIRGYKSIEFCDVTLEPLTILVGRNASGKSNFLDALGFVADLMRKPVSEAVYNRDGWRSLLYRTAPTPAIEITIEAAFESNQSTWEAEYSFALESTSSRQVRVQRERLTLRGERRGHECGFTRIGDETKWIGWSDPIPVTFFPPKLSDTLLLRGIRGSAGLDFAFGLQASRTYNFHPQAMRGHKPIGGSPVLDRDGANLVRVIEGLREIDPKTLSRITRYLQVIVPGVNRFRTQEYGDYETVRFTMNEIPGQPPEEFDASSMSDGTLRILATLVAAFQVVLPGGYPGFVGIEEPETSLHPAVTNALVDALDEATLRTQILLTTHSAELLDNSTIKPKNVRVVQMVDGRTVIGPIDSAGVEIVERHLNSLGGLERENQLEVDLDDQDRQRALSLKEESR